MTSPLPFLNATTIGKITDEMNLPEVWDSFIRTSVTSLLLSLVGKLILLVHLARSNAAGAQIVAMDGHRGGSVSSVKELLANRRKGALPHMYSRRYLLTLLFLIGIAAYRAADYAISAMIQQKGSQTVVVNELPIELRRVSRKEIHADFGCINKQLTFRNGQSDLAVGLCNIPPVPTAYSRECVGLVRRDLEGMYGIYHPRGIKLLGLTLAGTTLIGPMVVSGNTKLYWAGTLPILEVKIREELVRNMFSDVVSGERTVERLKYKELVGSVQLKGLGLCGEVNASAVDVINKLVGGLGFAEGKSRVLDSLGNQATVEVVTSASRTSIRIVIMVGCAAIAGHIVLYIFEKLLGMITGVSSSVSTVTSLAISQAAGNDCAMPAAVANGSVNLKAVNTLGEEALHYGVYRADEAPEDVDEEDDVVKRLLRRTGRNEGTYQGSKLKRRNGRREDVRDEC